MSDIEIILSDDEEDRIISKKKETSDISDDCVFIEETTIVNDSKNKEEIPSSFSLTDMIKSKETSIHTQMAELEKIMESRRNTSKPSTSNSRNIWDSDSDSEIMPDKEPKRRKLEGGEKTKEDRDEAKRAREEKKKNERIEKDKRKEEAIKKKDLKEKEKDLKRIEREVSASLNSKCELYTFCHVGKAVLEQIPGLEAEIRLLFSDRKIDDQFVIENSLGTRIEWRRKCIEVATGEDGKCERLEYYSTQDLFAILVPAHTLKEVIAAESLTYFIAEQRSKFRTGRSTMIILTYGKLDISKKKIYQLALEIYEKHKAQIVQIDTPSEVALFTAQYLRSLARREKKRVELQREDSSGSGGHKVQYLGEKGITIGSRTDIVSDWWNKMLITIDRLSDAQRRAIINKIPDPITAIDKYSKMDYSTAIQEIGNIVAENNRKVGPVMAHRIYTMLTDETGNSIVD